MNESPTLPIPQDPGEGQETPLDDHKETRLIEVAQTIGLASAQILAGRLQSEGIPAFAWQEGAGQAAGLVVGLLGAGHVMVPEAYEEIALEILADEDVIDEVD